MLNILSSRKVGVVGSPSPFKNAKAKVAAVLRTRPRSVLDAVEEGQQQEEFVDDKIRVAQHRFEAYLDELLHFLSQQNGGDPRKLESIKATISTDPTSTATLMDEGCSFLHYSKSCVNALQTVQNEQESEKDSEESDSSNRTAEKWTKEQEAVQLLALTWESLGHFLVLIHKFLHRHYRKFLLEQSKKQQHQKKSSFPRRVLFGATPSCGISQQTINLISEVVVTCHKEYILLNNKKIRLEKKIRVVKSC